MPFEVMLDGPDEYRSLPGPSYEGANPNLLLRIEELLLEHEDRIVALDAAMFLFSAPRLARALLAQGRAGTRVRVYTTPLDSYHRSPVVLHDRPGQRMSKRDIAGRILTYFAEQGQESGVELRIFSHVFLRSARYRRFERGSLPYSLHTKTLRILLDDGEEIVVLSTSNLTAADETKDELLVITGPGPADPAVEQFFDLLEASSHPLTVEADILDYPIRSVAEGIVSPIHRFTGPFLDRSNDRAADVLRAHVEGARERLVVAAEHIAAGDFTIEGSQCADARSGRVRRRGVLSPLLDGDVRPDRVTLLSQTSGRRQAGRRTGNTAAFTAFEDAFAATGAGRHYAADSNHLKFIVADDVVLIGSSNLTPTSFAYLPNVELVLPADLQRTAPGRRFRCIHSEVGHWIRLHDRALADTLEEHVAQIAARPGTVRLA
jgi:phosphatidylserine/phosphatidylglycerophosphate/cardiolipin synthase-like enzyme